MPWRIPLPRPIGFALVFGALALLLAWLTRGLSTSLINPDEGAHYVNALFLGDWIRAGFPSPMAFAQDYYAHFPRLSIGHWPPGWYMIEAPFFALLRPSPLGALMLGAFVAGLPAGAIVWAFQRLGRLRLGVALGAGYVLLPLVVDGARYVLLDQPVALVVALAAIAWAWATDRPGWWRFLVFAVLAAAAPLVKGNGALVALVPAIDIALGGRWRLLRHPGLWFAALVAVALVVPWYWLSFRISAGGFVYEPGLDYAAMAIAANATAIWTSVGPAGLLLAGFGLVSAFRADDADEKRVARLALAVVIATLVFQSVVPAAIEPRYISPLLPWLVVLIGIGLIGFTREARWRTAGGALAWLTLVPALVALWSLPAKPDIGAPALAREMARDGGIWLVDGRAGEEGAIIAAAAHADDERRQLWVARASQWLSTSDFLGRGYTLSAPSPRATRGVLDRIGAGGVVSLADRNRYAWPHSRILFDSLRGGDFVLAKQPFVQGTGTVLVARRWMAIRPNVALIEENSGSANVGKMKATLR